ncbi:MAG: hypothetical protein ACLSGI_08085 [Butyricicoccaceae bacterium]
MPDYQPTANSKMSKSDPNPNGYILLMDKPEDIMRKFKRVVTDSDSRIIFDPQNKPVFPTRCRFTLWRPARPSTGGSRV